MVLVWLDPLVKRIFQLMAATVDLEDHYLTLVVSFIVDDQTSFLHTSTAYWLHQRYQETPLGRGVCRHYN